MNDCVNGVAESRIKWVAYVTCLEEKRNAYRLLVGNHEGRRCVGDQLMDGRIVLTF
jgi:hypothetical protein